MGRKFVVAPKRAVWEDSHQYLLFDYHLVSPQAGWAAVRSVVRRNARVWDGEIETINRFSKTLNGFYAK